MASKGASDFIARHIAHQGDECVLWPWTRNPVNGYAQGAYRRRHGNIHRIMCELAHGAAPTPQHVAAHSCHVRHCINPRHLSWKTASENMLDKRENGTVNHAFWGRYGKLTAEQATRIFDLKGQMTQAKIAARFSITESNVRNIHKGKTWTARIAAFRASAADTER